MWIQMIEQGSYNPITWVLETQLINGMSMENICLHFVICVKKDSWQFIQCRFVLWIWAYDDIDMPRKTREYMWIIIHCWYVIAYDNHWQSLCTGKYPFCTVCLNDYFNFIHAKPWIPGGDKSIFMAVIHQWRLLLRQFARATAIGEYDVTMPLPYVRVTPQIICGDVTIINQKKPSLAAMAKSAIDDWF